MVGFYGGAPLEYEAINEQGTEAVPASTGEVLSSAFGQGFAANLFPRLMRSQGRFASETGVLGVDDFGNPIMGEPDPQLDPETANAEYGIKGALSFDKPVAQSVAKDLSDQKRAQIDREDAIARRESGLLTGGAARFTANIAAGLLDPINLAAGFIPFVGEERAAALLGRGALETMGAGERAGVRALTGAGQGAASMVALQPLEFGLSRGEREDYTMADAMRNIAVGGLLGGGLHVVGGAVADRVTGRYANPLTQRLEDAGPEAREAALQGALGQTIEGRPVDVAPALDVFSPAPEMRRPPDIIDFLMDRGGVRDEGGELRDMDLQRPMKGRFGTLSRRNGLPLDTAREYAVEAGYLRPDATIRDLLDALGDTSRGRPIFRPDEAARWFDAEQARFAAERGDSDDPFHPDNLFGDLTAAARRQPLDELAAKIDADAVMARPSDELQAIQQQIAELKRQSAPPGAEVQSETTTPRAAQPTNEVIGREEFIRGHTDAAGTTDLGAASDALTDRVKAALDEGRQVTLYADGKAVPITAVERGRMKDSSGHQWGTITIATDKGGGNRIEISGRPKREGVAAVEPVDPGEARASAVERAAYCISRGFG